MTPLPLVALAIAGMAVAMLLLWLLQRRTGNAGVVDVGWSAGVGAAGIAFALLAVLFAVPVLVVASDPRPLDPSRTALAIGLWLTAVGGETVADRQLARFRAEPANRGRTCRVGLWRLSRHPNYFFEWLGWWPWVVLGVDAAWGGLTLLGPVLMLAFLLFVTGVPATEARAAASRPDYADYRRTTSAFIPWFPRREEPVGETDESEGRDGAGWQGRRASRPQA